MTLLVALLKLHPRPFEPISVDKKETFISPLTLAKTIRDGLFTQLRSDRSNQIMQDVLTMVGSKVPPHELREALLIDDGIFRSLATIKNPSPILRDRSKRWG